MIMGEKKMEPLLKPKEAAKYLNISIERLKHFVYLKSVPSYSFGSHRRFCRQALSRWVDSKRIGNV